MRLSNEKYEEIKAEVTDLFERFSVCCIPISGFELALKMGIILVPYSSLTTDQFEIVMSISTDGLYLEPGDGKEYIYYNDSIGYERANMTILHEIGHCALGHHEDMDPEVVEAEAKFFAKYAVAPPPLVHRIQPGSPSEIADAFQISYQAAEIAYGYYKTWLIMHQKNGSYYSYERRLLYLFRYKEVFKM